MTIDRKSHSYLLGLAEAELKSFHEVLRDLVGCVEADLSKLPEGYVAREALERAKAKLCNNAIKELEAA